MLILYSFTSELAKLRVEKKNYFQFNSQKLEVKSDEKF